MAESAQKFAIKAHDKYLGDLAPSGILGVLMSPGDTVTGWTLDLANAHLFEYAHETERLLRKHAPCAYLVRVNMTEVGRG